MNATHAAPTQADISRSVLSLSVLLVEDSKSDAALIREVLDTSDAPKFRSVHVSDLRSATSIVAHEAFDAVLLDLGLPDSSDIASVQRIRNIVPDLPVIVLTGDEREETALRAVATGASDYLVKSFPLPSGTRLIRTIQRAIVRQWAMKAEAAARDRAARTAGSDPAKRPPPATAQTVNGQIAALMEELERSSLPPIVPGEAETWLAPLLGCLNRMAEPLTRFLEQSDLGSDTDMVEAAPHLWSRFMQLHDESEYLRHEYKRIAEHGRHLAKILPDLTKRAVNLGAALTRFADATLAFVIRFRRYEAAVRTWTLEALERDHGGGD